MAEKSLEKRQIDGNDAAYVLGKLQEWGVFEHVNAYLDRNALACDPDNEKMALRIILSKQILTSIQRELIKLVNDGKYAKINIEQIEEAKTLKQKVLRR